MNIDYTLYLCTDRTEMSKETIEECVEQAILGGVTIVQVREKNSNTLEFLNIANRVKKITSKYNVPLIINDRIDIALAVDADGVHLGQDDMPCDIARKILGKNKIIGISVTNVEQAIIAKENGANYIGVGAMYKSQTKPEAELVPMEELMIIRERVELPIILIGGINKTTIRKFNNIKIDGYAMISPIIAQHNIKISTQKLLEIISNNQPTKKY